MSQTNLAARLFIFALLVCAFIGVARAQDYYPPAAMDLPAQAGERDRQDDERGLADRRQKMIEECQQNHGSEVDCERETDTELRAEGMRVGARVIHLRPAR
jgi:hypothetical protein